MATAKTKKKKRRAQKVEWDGPKQGKPQLRIVRADVERNAPKYWKKDDWSYYRDLHKIIDAVFTEAMEQYDWTWSQLADHANLSYQTVAKLGDRETYWPRFSTIYKLCKAVGWELMQVKPKTKRKAPSVKVA